MSQDTNVHTDEANQASSLLDWAPLPGGKKLGDMTFKEVGWWGAFFQLVGHLKQQEAPSVSRDVPSLDQLEATLAELESSDEKLDPADAPPSQLSPALQELLDRQKTKYGKAANNGRSKAPTRRKDNQHPPGKADTDELLARAMRAYARYPGPGIHCHPSTHLSGAVAHNGKWFIKLANGTGTLAVFAVRNDGRLERRDDYPTAIDKKAAQ